MEDIFYYYLDKNSGILLVCGRFSYAIGINSLEEKLTVGGWGSKLIDDGSEYYIGLAAIKAAIAEYEMLGGKTILSEAIIKNLRLEDLKELKYILYYKKLNDKRIYSLSKEVLRCAKLGDRISINIISSAADKLFNMTDILIRRLNMYDTKYNLCLTGSIVEYGDYITNPLCDRIYSRYDNIEVFTHNNFRIED